jgi:hypothetical protein
MSLGNILLCGFNQKQQFFKNFNDMTNPVHLKCILRYVYPCISKTIKVFLTLSFRNKKYPFLLIDHIRL